MNEQAIAKLEEILKIYWGEIHKLQKELVLNDRYEGKRMSEAEVKATRRELHIYANMAKSVADDIARIRIWQSQKIVAKTI